MCVCVYVCVCVCVSCHRMANSFRVRAACEATKNDKKTMGSFVVIY